VYEDPDYNWQKHDPGLADDVEELLHESDNYANANTGPDQMQRDELKHQEAVFLHGMREALTEKLRGQNIRCTKAGPDGYGEGYVVTCVDKQGRQYTANMTFDASIALHATYGQNTGRAIVDDICKKILAARARYFARMQ
jgi:hypothetical protein